jgi:hypothetical protein
MTRIYKESYTVTNDTIILQFRESFVQSLLFGMPFEKLKPGSKQQLTSHLKRKLAGHKVEEKEGSARNVSEGAVLVVTRKTRNNNQEKRAMQQQRE